MTTKCMILSLVLGVLTACGTASEKPSHPSDTAVLIFLDDRYSSTASGAEESACAEAKGNCIDAIRWYRTGDCRKVKGGSYPNPDAKEKHLAFYGYCEYDFFK